jgi:hypothetical protein
LQAVFLLCSKQTYQRDFPQEIAVVYFQKQITVKEVASVLIFISSLKLSKELFWIGLFPNQVGVVEIERDNFVAHFIDSWFMIWFFTAPHKEYGNKAPL